MRVERGWGWGRVGGAALGWGRDTVRFYCRAGTQDPHERGWEDDNG